MRGQGEHSWLRQWCQYMCSGWTDMGFYKPKSIFYNWSCCLSCCFLSFSPSMWLESRYVFPHILTEQLFQSAFICREVCLGQDGLLSIDHNGFLDDNTNIDTNLCPLNTELSSYLLVWGAVDLGACEAAGGGCVELVSPAQEQVIAGWVTSPARAVTLGLWCCSHGCQEEGRTVRNEMLQCVVTICKHRHPRSHPTDMDQDIQAQSRKQEKKDQSYNDGLEKGSSTQILPAHSTWTTVHTKKILMWD